MQLIGQAVKHSAFGKGIVTGLSSDRVTIYFSAGEKRFIYPDAFSKFLTLKNRKMQKKIQDRLDEIAAVERTKAEKMQREQEKEYLLRNVKISPCGQAVFHVAPEQREAVFSAWSISTGRYASGNSKGKLRIPERMKPNSMCLLTECVKGKEEERSIIGAFMVQEDFLGSYCQDGMIEAHPDYRLRLPLEYQLPFWPYVTQQPGEKRWGRVVLKYISNKIGERILFDIKELPLDEENKKTAEHFYRYYCKLNLLQPEICDANNKSEA